MAATRRSDHLAFGGDASFRAGKASGPGSRRAAHAAGRIRPSAEALMAPDGDARNVAKPITRRAAAGRGKRSSVPRHEALDFGGSKRTTCLLQRQSAATEPGVGQWLRSTQIQAR